MQDMCGANGRHQFSRLGFLWESTHAAPAVDESDSPRTDDVRVALARLRGKLAYRGGRARAAAKRGARGEVLSCTRTVVGCVARFTGERSRYERLEQRTRHIERIEHSERIERGGRRQ